MSSNQPTFNHQPGSLISPAPAQPLLGFSQFLKSLHQRGNEKLTQNSDFSETELLKDHQLLYKDKLRVGERKIGRGNRGVQFTSYPASNINISISTPRNILSTEELLYERNIEFPSAIGASLQQKSTNPSLWGMNLKFSNQKTVNYYNNSIDGRLAIINSNDLFKNQGAEIWPSLVLRSPIPRVGKANHNLIWHRV
eukprot:Sdes_comp22297_c0_seq1m20778